MEKESSKAAAAYAAYEAMGAERSIEKVRKQSGRPQGYDRVLYRWSSLYHWQERVKQYDEQQREVERSEREAAEALKRQKRREDVEQMNDEQAQLFRDRRERIWDRLELLLKDDDDPDKVWDKDDRMRVTPQVLATLLKTAIDTERVARGATATSDEQQDHSQKLVVEIVTVEDWRHHGMASIHRAG
jgi:hypothetical protein